ncbi:MAG: DUF1674 domain-containing protein [Bacteroidota bacterium]
MSGAAKSVLDANDATTNTPPSPDERAKAVRPAEQRPDASAEIGGPQGPEPTRYGDWERKGRCIDF